MRYPIIEDLTERFAAVTVGDNNLATDSELGILSGARDAQCVHTILHKSCR